ncbi:MAG: HAD-superfamily hydrolase, subfamily variant 3 [Frankiales bacterium]|nr:HAD-superfamily hydrolase, subfamily variant 3 [Frankiales bacterium]
MSVLLLDFDGTLLDSESTHLQSWEEAYALHGRPFDRAAWVAGVGGHGHDPSGPLVGLGFDPDARRARERELVHALEVRAGVRELLALPGRFAVVSSSPRSWVVPHLERLGLLGALELVVTREDAPRPKPAPDLYLEALRRLGVDAAVAVEDSANGVTAAKAAGLPVVAVPGPVTAGQDLSLADLRVASLLEVDLPALCQGRLTLLPSA